MKNYRALFFSSAIIIVVFIAILAGTSLSIEVQFLEKGNPCSHYTLSLLQPDGETLLITLDAEGKTKLPFELRKNVLSLKVLKQDGAPICDFLNGVNLGKTKFDITDDEIKMEYYRNYLFGIYTMKTFTSERT